MSLQRKVDRESKKCARTFGRMEILVGRTQDLIDEVQESIAKAKQEKEAERKAAEKKLAEKTKQKMER